MNTVLQIHNPDAGQIPFVQRALRSIKCAPEDIDFAAVLDAYEVWVAFDPLPAALIILSFGKSPLKDIPSVVHIYSEGNNSARGALVEHAARRIREEGYTHCLAGNWSDGTDDAWCRLFKRGGSFEKVGSTFLIEVGADD